MTTDNPKTTQIRISDSEPGLPFSKGLMASQVMVTGLSPFRAYQVAEAIEDRLLSSGRAAVSSEELWELAHATITELAGERYARNYRRWREVERLDVPLVILIGGATGVGKSTIATHLAARLGIVRVQATDAVREVMRSMLSKELMPSLHVSTYQSDSGVREAPVRREDALQLGFWRQIHDVSVGVHALIERAAAERTSVVIEGAHVVPGFFDVESFEDRILAVPFVVTVEDEERHLAHFAAREDAVGARPAERYVKGFDNIRRLQDYITSQAMLHEVPVIPNHSFDRSIAAAIELVMERATLRAERSAREAIAVEGGTNA